jgi:GH15 family glucan-1,4-alpha-glucosidase
MGPVRVGNLAWKQVQHDVYGSVMLASTQLFFDQRLQQPGDATTFARLEPLGEQAWRMHDQPDAGLWEFRGRASVHTYSSVMCWAACDRLAKIAARFGLAERMQHWRGRAERIREKILANAWNSERGHFADAFGGERLDASLLLLADTASSTRWTRYIATWRRSARVAAWTRLYRYIAPDDFGAPETSFTICTFWYVEALAAIGRHEEARELFESVLARRNPLGLLSEDLGFEDGEAWGNFRKPIRTWA